MDTALWLELQQSWESSDRGQSLYEVTSRVGREWQPFDTDRVPQRDVTLVARFLTGHCHLGFFSLPWDPLGRVACPLCCRDFTREHLLWDCPKVRLQREEILGHVVEEGGKDLGWFSCSGFGLLRRFLRAIRPAFQIQ